MWLLVIHKGAHVYSALLAHRQPLLWEGLPHKNQLYAYTNGGPCVDIFAPGAFIHAASHSCTVCYKYRSGTSMATPLVSGAVAIMLGRQPQLTPVEVHRLVIDHSIKDALDFYYFISE